MSIASSTTASVPMPTAAPQCPTGGGERRRFDMLFNAAQDDFITCFAPYSKGERAAGALNVCCGNQPTVVEDSWADKDEGCYYFCNVTTIPADQSRTGTGFFLASDCAMRQNDKFNNSIGVMCRPRRNAPLFSKAGSPSPSTSAVGIGLAVMVVGGILFGRL